MADKLPGDVFGPASATDGNLASIDSTGKVLSDSGVSPSGLLSAAADEVITGEWTYNADLTIGLSYRLMVDDGTPSLPAIVSSLYPTTGLSWTDFLGAERLVVNVEGATVGTWRSTGLSVTGDIQVTGTVAGRDIAADGTRLDTIEDNADVTDSTNVDAAGAVMNSDTSTASMGFVIDEDDMASDSDTKVPSQQSVKAYVDSNAGVLDINGLTAFSGSHDTAVDFVPMYDNSAAANRKIQVQRLSCAVPVGAPAGYSGVASVDIALGSSRRTRVWLTDHHNATDATELWMRLSDDGGSTFFSGAGDYEWAARRIAAGGTASSEVSTSDTQINLARDIGAGTDELAAIVIDIFKLSGSRAIVSFQSVYVNSGNYIEAMYGGGRCIDATLGDVDTIRILASSGNVSGYYYVEDLGG